MKGPIHRAVLKKPREEQAQSAIEYITTYGWAILVIATVVVVLLYLGLFSNNLSNNLCVGTAGYVCSSPLLLNNGLLSVAIEPISSSALSVTGLGCSNSSAAPSTFVPQNIPFEPLQPTSLSFHCNLPSNSLGATFSGTLWVEYRSGTATGVSQVSTIDTKVETGASTSGYSLSVTPGESGTGTVSCSLSCSGSYSAGTQITLTATPSVGYAFSGWTGTYSNSINPWTFNMPSNTVDEHANFIPTPETILLAQTTGIPRSLAVDGNGNVQWVDESITGGSITEMPNGITGISNAITIYPGGSGCSEGIAIGTNGNIYWTDVCSGNVMEMPSGKAGIDNAITLYSGGTTLEFIAVHNGNVYWTTYGYSETPGTVMEMPQGRTGNDNTITLYSGASGVYRIAVDTIGNVYWTNNLNGTVTEMPHGKTGSANAITLYSEGSNPYGIAVDTIGNVYWTDATANLGSVMEMPHGMAGNNNAITLSSDEPITNGAPSSNPAGIAVDTIGNVYWTDYGTGNLMEMPHGLVGDSNVITLYSGVGSENPDGIAVHGSNVYWAGITGAAIREYAP